MTAIAMCYVVTPLLQWSRRFGKYQFVIVLLLCIVDTVFLSCRFWYVYLYAISYFLASPSWKEYNGLKLFIILMLWCGLLCILQWNDLLNTTWVGILWKCVTGLLSLSFFLSLVGRIEFKHNFLIATISKYSYYIYIVHHLPIMMPFSILIMTDWPIWTRIVLLIVVIIISVAALNFMSKEVGAVFNKVFKLNEL